MQCRWGWGGGGSSWAAALVLIRRATAHPRAGRTGTATPPVAPWWWWWCATARTRPAARPSGAGARGTCGESRGHGCRAVPRRGRRTQTASRPRPARRPRPAPPPTPHPGGGGVVGAEARPHARGRAPPYNKPGGAGPVQWFPFRARFPAFSSSAGGFSGGLSLGCAAGRLAGQLWAAGRLLSPALLCFACPRPPITGGRDVAPLPPGVLTVLPLGGYTHSVTPPPAACWRRRRRPAGTVVESWSRDEFHTFSLFAIFAATSQYNIYLV
jgi:hypothetical protein